MYGDNLKLFKSEFIPVLLLAKILSSQKQSQEWKFSLKRYPNIIKYKKFGSCNGSSFTNSTDLHHCSYQGLTLRAWRSEICAWRFENPCFAIYGTDFHSAMLCMHSTSHGPVSVCLSVCVTNQCSTKTAEHRITKTKPHDSSGSLASWHQRSPRNSTRVTPYRDAKCRWGGSKSATFDK